ncbi:hypothetical protein [Aestuariirhabdus litorea]|uniref:PBP domain-containing protein n=1 Tax=Aestuariirhabdus litorea TaxID=2528527 RepID=A0A3P3VJG7_9GAMM|nr:hypothetical protein [Aestuariirhabdus litorea]RRJ82832.1 hypothetical protein D0544_13355 [Aestuariirhabdus litorea]RWW92991.1 hypothetical protein DZC74_13330 [Endozoicomonadaceae bacterium GTF-13]
MHPIWRSLPLILLLMLLTRSGALYAEQTQIIAHPGVPVSYLSFQQLKAIFTSKQSVWPTGERISLFVLPASHPLQKAFCAEQMRLYCYQLERSWQRLLYSGFGTPPQQVEDERQLVQKVASTPGAIGFARKDYVDTQIKIIRVR